MNERTISELLTEIAERKGSSVHQLAREAGVANRTFSAALRGDYIAGKVDPSIVSFEPRKLRGYVESLTRLARFAGKDIERVLSEFGISLEWRGVRQAIASVQPHPTAPQPEKPQNTIVAGIHSWSAIGANDDPDASQMFARKYTRALMGAFNSSLELDFVTVDVIGAGLEQLCQDEPELDLLIGVSASHSRTLRGISFVEIPGLGTPLSMLCCGERGFTWQRMWRLDEESPSTASELVFLVVQDEIGDNFLSSMVPTLLNDRYDIRRINQTDSFHIATTLLDTTFNGSETAVFVADLFTIRKVRREVRRIAGMQDADLRKHFRETILPEDVRRVARGIYGSTDGHGGHFRDSTVPTYPMSIAISPRHSEWLRPLIDCQQDVLFSQYAPVVARYYDRLLDNADGLVPISLTKTLRYDTAKAFYQLVRAESDRRSDEKGLRRHDGDQFIAFWGSQFNTLPPGTPVGLHTEDAKTILIAAEARILNGDDGLRSGSIINSIIFSQLLECSETFARSFALPTLAGIGLLEPRSLSSGDTVLSFIQAELPDSYVVPRLVGEGDSRKADRFMFWERFHLEVTFACLLACQGDSQKQPALEQLHMLLNKARSKRESSLSSWLILDREFHLTICRDGSPEGRTLTAVRSLERAFNRLNSALVPHYTVSRQLASANEHEEILAAIQSANEMPKLTDYDRIVDSYVEHVFDSDVSRDLVKIDDDFTTKMRDSVLREVASLEGFTAAVFFEGMRCQILRSHNSMPLEWEQDRQIELIDLIAEQVNNGCELYYVIIGSREFLNECRDAFNRFYTAIRITLQATGRMNSAPIPVVMYAVDPSYADPFIKESQERRSEALLAHINRQGLAESQLTIRKQISEESKGEIRRQLGKTVREKESFLKDFVSFQTSYFKQSGKRLELVRDEQWFANVFGF